MFVGLESTRAVFLLSLFFVWFGLIGISLIIFEMMSKLKAIKGRCSLDKEILLAALFKVPKGKKRPGLSKHQKGFFHFETIKSSSVAKPLYSLPL